MAVWAEPELALYVSVADRETFEERRHTRFWLTRSRWAEGWAARGGHGPDEERIALVGLEEQLPLLLEKLMRGTLEDLPASLPVNQ